MSKTVFFIYKAFVVGGAELLMQKMAKVIAKSGIQVGILCRDIDDGQRLVFQKAGAFVEIVKNWESKLGFQAILNRFENVECVVFSYDDYLKVQSVRHRQKKTVFYAIHYMALTMEKNMKLFAFRSGIMKQVIHAALERNSILCMDEQTVRFTKSFYSEERIDALYDNILRICVEVPEMTAKVCAQQEQNANMKVLSIARADFPFKGYLIGLIDSFRESWIHENFTLDIVSYGKGAECIQQHIDALPEEARGRICMHGKMNYAEMEPLFERAKLYIGMGTTVLDAACRGIITIPVKAYTYEICCEHFFHEDYRDVALENGSKERYEALLRCVANMTQAEYMETSCYTAELAREHYDVRNTSVKLMRHFENVAYDCVDGRIILAEKLRESKCFAKYIIKKIREKISK